MEATVQGAPQVLETGQFCRQTGPGGRSVLEVGCGSKMILETGSGGGFWGQDDEPCRQHREWGQAGAWFSEPRENSGHCSTTRTNDRSNKTVKNPTVNIFGRAPWRVPVAGGWNRTSRQQTWSLHCARRRAKALWTWHCLGVSRFALFFRFSLALANTERPPAHAQYTPRACRSASGQAVARGDRIPPGLRGRVGAAWTLRAASLALWLAEAAVRRSHRCRRLGSGEFRTLSAGRNAPPANLARHREERTVRDPARRLGGTCAGLGFQAGAAREAGGDDPRGQAGRAGR